MVTGGRALRGNCERGHRRDGPGPYDIGRLYCACGARDREATRWFALYYTTSLAANSGICTKSGRCASMDAVRPSILLEVNARRV
eukprot:4514457-Prymnesium_polylepis.1